MRILKSKKVNAKKWNQTKWYTIDENRLSELCSKPSYHSQNPNKIGLYKFRPIDSTKSDQCYKYTRKYLYKASSKRKEEVLEIQNTTDKDTLAQQVFVWNEVFAYSLKPIKAYVNRNNSSQLLRILAEHFEGSLERWKEYAVKVNSSKFLMGEKQTQKGFKATFAWLIKPETIQAILAGEYGVGDRVADMHNVKHNVEVQKIEIAERLDQMVKDRISDVTEHRAAEDKREFEELLLRADDISSEDNRYGLRDELRMWGVSARSLLYWSGVTQREKMLRKGLFETFLLRKYIGADRFMLRKGAKSFLDTEVMGDGPQALEKLRTLSAQLHAGKFDMHCLCDGMMATDAAWRGKHVEHEPMIADEYAMVPEDGGAVGKDATDLHERIWHSTCDVPEERYGSFTGETWQKPCQTTAICAEHNQRSEWQGDGVCLGADDGERPSYAREQQPRRECLLDDVMCEESTEDVLDTAIGTASKTAGMLVATATRAESRSIGQFYAEYSTVRAEQHCVTSARPIAHHLLRFMRDHEKMSAHAPSM